MVFFLFLKIEFKSTQENILGFLLKEFLSFFILFSPLHFSLKNVKEKINKKKSDKAIPTKKKKKEHEMFWIS